MKIAFRKKRIKALFLFFKSLLPFIVAMAIFTAFIFAASLREMGIRKYIIYVLKYLPIGTFLGLISKEIAHPEEYYFYYNLGLNKITLWIGSILLSYSFLMAFGIINILW